MLIFVASILIVFRLSTATVKMEVQRQNISMSGKFCLMHKMEYNNLLIKNRAGHADDFNRLVSLGVQLEGKIALSKYGNLYRGVKVKNAQAHGMVGVVIFTDPGSDGPQAAKGDIPYPNGPARQPSSIQRGSVVDLTAMTGGMSKFQDEK